jgi:hypothetical protein
MLDESPPLFFVCGGYSVYFCFCVMNTANEYTAREAKRYSHVLYYDVNYDTNEHTISDF